MDRVRDRIDAQDRVETTIGHPRRAVRAHDDAVRRRAAAEGELVHMARTGVQAAERAGCLGGEPYGAVGCGRHVVRAAALGKWKLGPSRRGLGACRPGEKEQKRYSDECLHGGSRLSLR